ncbi:MAG: hypothetical protein Q8M07_07320, partial [Prosthecobacter sp.]|nr:hypothetical protein [Prosthecobacter sp.]
ETRKMCAAAAPRRFTSVMHTTPVACPSCFQEFEVPAPSFDEVPCDVDYDCEVCCRPLRIFFEEADGEVIGTAYGLGASGPYG